MSEINGHDQLTSHESAITNIGAALMLVVGSACDRCKEFLPPDPAGWQQVGDRDLP